MGHLVVRRLSFYSGRGGERSSRLRRRGPDEPPCAAEDGVPHRPRQESRVGVAPARMERAEEGPAVRKCPLGAVREARSGRRSGPVPIAVCLEEVFEGEPTQDHDDLDAVEQPDLRLEVGPTIGEFLEGRLVLGRGAAGRGRNVAVDELEPVVARHRGGPAGEAEAVQGLVQPVAARVSGEHTAGAVSAVRGGGETDHQKTRASIAESRDRFAPVLPLQELALLVARDLPAIRAQPRATLARHDRAPDFLQGTEAHAAQDYIRTALTVFGSGRTYSGCRRATQSLCGETASEVSSPA